MLEIHGAAGHDLRPLFLPMSPTDGLHKISVPTRKTRCGGSWPPHSHLHGKETGAASAQLTRTSNTHKIEEIYKSSIRFSIFQRVAYNGAATYRPD